MRLAWFSPLPPTRSGIAAYSAELLPLVCREHAVDVFVDTQPVRADGLPYNVRAAHDFLWQRRLTPYDLVVYQLGNAPCHDYMWGYLASCPGLVVLHDTRLHHSRARTLLSRGRVDDYRAEFRYDHPNAPPDAAEYAVNGLGGEITYFWPMRKAAMETARLIVVHGERMADELRFENPTAPVEVVRMGVAGTPADRQPEDARLSIRAASGIPANATVFTAFGKVTAEKRIGAVLRALASVCRNGLDAYLLLVGDADDYSSLAAEMAALEISDHVRVTGYVADEDMHAYLCAADICLCLRWPSAGETSASWLRCLAASRATIVSELAQFGDLPVLDAKSWHAQPASSVPVAVQIDLLDEDATLASAMRRLASDRVAVSDIARAGYEFWSANHTVERMAADYLRVIKAAADQPAPIVRELPAHFTDDHTGLLSGIARRFGVTVDIIPQ